MFVPLPVLGNFNPKLSHAGVSEEELTGVFFVTK